MYISVPLDKTDYSTHVHKWIFGSKEHIYFFKGHLKILFKVLNHICQLHTIKYCRSFKTEDYLLFKFLKTR